MRQPEKQNPAGGRGFAEHIHDRELHDDDTPERGRVPILLRHHASVVESAGLVLCEGNQISEAGRRVLQHTADRLRQIAEIVR
jgi:hypothetical protein